MTGESNRPGPAPEVPFDSTPSDAPSESTPTEVCSTLARRFEIYGAASLYDLELLRSMGFDQVILDNHGFADAAEALGFSVVLANWWDRQTTLGEILPVLRQAMGLSRLVSVNMMDEPIRCGLKTHGPEVYLRLRREILETGFERPLSLTLHGPKPDWPTPWLRVFMDYLGAIDILRIDPYAFCNGDPSRLVGDWINLARQFMATAGRDLPLTVVIEAWDGGKGLPPIDEIRAMAYMALLSMADTLSFFSYDPATWSKQPGFIDKFAALIRELEGLAGEFAGAEVRSILGADDLFQAEIDQDGDFTCITVNTRDRPNGRFGPYQVVRSDGRCARPFPTVGPPEDFPVRRYRTAPPAAPSVDRRG
jgi:hypothetical protein